MHGPAGVGKTTLAIGIAKMLLCPKQGCSNCPTCRRVDTRNHSDFRLVQREEGSKELKIEQIREIQQEINLKPMEGPNKVFILGECQFMSEEAANCLLKTLEEPPKRSFLFLLTEVPEALPATIRSRCQEVRVPLRPPSEIEGILIHEAALSPERARFLARMAEGSVGRALEMHQKDLPNLVAWLRESLRALEPDRELKFANELLARVEQAGDNPEGQRAELRLYLNALNTFWRDLLYQSLGIGSERFFQGDEASLAFYLEFRMRPTEALAAIELSIQAEEWLRHNANLKLVMENYVVDLCRLVSVAERPGWPFRNRN